MLNRHHGFFGILLWLVLVNTHDPIEQSLSQLNAKLHRNVAQVFVIFMSVSILDDHSVLIHLLDKTKRHSRFHMESNQMFSLSRKTFRKNRYSKLSRSVFIVQSSTKHSCFSTPLDRLAQSENCISS